MNLKQQFAIFRGSIFVSRVALFLNLLIISCTSVGSTGLRYMLLGTGLPRVSWNPPGSKVNYKIQIIPSIKINE